MSLRIKVYKSIDTSLRYFTKIFLKNAYPLQRILKKIQVLKINFDAFGLLVDR